MDNDILSWLITRTFAGGLIGWGYLSLIKWWVKWDSVMESIQ